VFNQKDPASKTKSEALYVPLSIVTTCARLSDGSNKSPPRAKGPADSSYAFDRFVNGQQQRSQSVGHNKEKGSSSLSCPKPTEIT
jgi:hypothetical protein